MKKVEVSLLLLSVCSSWCLEAACVLDRMEALSSMGMMLVVSSCHFANQGTSLGTPLGSMPSNL
eukprot:4215952-Pleurochrysis_carterae.AAC.1